MIIHWGPSPVAMKLGPLVIRWYSLGFLVSFFLSLKIMKKMCKAENLPTEQLDNLLFYIIFGTIIGARLGHCFFYEFDYFYKHPLEIFAVWHGGLASHGGVVGVVTAIVLFARKYKDYSLSWILDRASVLTALAGGFIRIGNLMNSEIIGKTTNADWGVVFTKIDQVPRHPTQIYESVGYFSIFLIGYFFYKRFKFQPPQFFLLGLNLCLVFMFRFVMEFFKENQEPFEKNMILNMGQILSIPAILVGIFFFILFTEKKNT